MTVTSRQIVFEAEKGNNYEGIIALDELVLHADRCSVVGPTDAPDTRSGLYFLSLCSLFDFFIVFCM